MTTESSRPSWDEYFTRLVDEIASRATCDRGRSGCLIVRDKRIICEVETVVKDRDKRPLLEDQYYSCIRRFVKVLPEDW